LTEKKAVILNHFAFRFMHSSRNNSIEIVYA
jgi:hypothetical protein